MYTTEQALILRQYRKILAEYNSGNMDYQTFVDKTLPLWDKLNTLFERYQKTS